MVELMEMYAISDLRSWLCFSSTGNDYCKCSSSCGNGSDIGSGSSNSNVITNFNYQNNDDNDSTIVNDDFDGKCNDSYYNE